MTNLHASISLNASTVYTLRDELLDDGHRITCITVGDDELTIHLSAWQGDAGLIATTGVLSDLLERVRAGAMSRERDRITAMFPLPDGLDAATIADALAGWTEGELREAFSA